MHSNSTPLPPMLPSSSVPLARPYHSASSLAQYTTRAPHPPLPSNLHFQQAIAYGYEVVEPTHEQHHGQHQYQHQHQQYQYDANYHHHQQQQQQPHQASVSPQIKMEQLSLVDSPVAEPVQSIPSSRSSWVNISVLPIAKAKSTNAITFASTEVDCLMREIQSKQVSPAPEQLALCSQTQAANQEEAPLTAVLVNDDEFNIKNPGVPRPFHCDEDECRGTFIQKTHLEIHTRVHTGELPFACTFPECDRKFSQMGNLRTHERRHIGDRPYSCEICHKSFAQRGNVRAHQVIHSAQKPFTCKLDSCRKQFTQLGNMKSHQNKFHADTIRELTKKLAQYSSLDQIPLQDEENLRYFASLYKNANKGIKGRGKDRRVVTVARNYPAAAMMYPSEASSEYSSDYRSRSSSYASPLQQPRQADYYSHQYDGGYNNNNNNQAAFPECRY